MGKQSAGILLYRFRGNKLEMLLVHPGGPFFARKDAGVWSIPKGEFAEGEKPVDAARREFSEEMGTPVPDGELIELGHVKQPGGKTVYAWALEADFDAAAVRSNTFAMEWPPKSGSMQSFPEVDRAAWLPMAAGLTKVSKGQVPLLQALAEKLGMTTGLPEQSSLF